MLAITNGSIGSRSEIAPDMQKTLIKQPEIISFNYDDEDLVNVINYIASKKEINLLLPTKADDKIVGKFTWHLDKKVTINQAWDLINTILSIAGYSIVPKEGFYEIVKTTRAINGQPMPIYIGTSPEQLPASDQRIRYLYYLENIKTEAEGENDSLNKVLKGLLPSDATFQIDSAANALLIMAKSNDIKSMMSIVTQIDRPGFLEKMEIISLKHTEAPFIEKLFNKNILQQNETNRYRIDTQKKSDISYFSRHIKIIAQPRTNSLIVLGRAQSVVRIRDFINHYLDVEQDSGKSILHVYQLLYRDARQFAKVLENIVLTKKTEGLEQATGETKVTTGPQRYFGEVIIEVDTPEGSETEVGTGPDETETSEQGSEASTIIKQSKYYGGNKLIIAARDDDWKRIKELIEKLDQPEPQVLIEVLIADLSLDDSKALGSFFRNPENLSMPGETNFQAAHLQPGVMTDSFEDPQTVGVIKNADGTVKAASDLLRQFHIDSETGVRTDTGDPLTNIAKGLTPGSTVISLNDTSGKTWGITQILKLIDNTKILSHPHIISTNNQQAQIEVTETRRLRDQASGSQGGTVVSTRKDVPASLKVKIIPRISISDIREDTVNMQVLIDINEYKSSASTGNNTRITRNVHTNATVVTGDILAIGGLIRTNETDSVSETPLLSKIPLIGWLFKKRSKSKKRTNLTVFISPTIIESRLRSGVGEYTKDYLNITKQIAQSGELFDSLKDPITRWFFGGESTTESFTRDFMKEDEMKDKPPMPHPERKKPVLAQADPIPQPIGTEQQKKQASNLKDLLQSIDNPFENIRQPATAA